MIGAALGVLVIGCRIGAVIAHRLERQAVELGDLLIRIGSRR